MYGITSGAPDVRTLREELSGAVTVAGDAGWDNARAAWNLAVDQRPAAVAEPETVADVVAIVRFARERGMRVAAQGTGHGAAALGSLEDTVLVKMHRTRPSAVTTWIATTSLAARPCLRDSQLRPPPSV